MVETLMDERLPPPGLSSRNDPPAPPGRDLATTVIEPTRGWRALDFRELWRYRELVYFLAWRDVKVR